MKKIDLRRDTITLPTDAMKKAAFNADLGDSVYGEDDEQAKLETLAAETTGKDAAIFLPSGTMGNLVAVLSHTHHGDEIITEENAHIFTSETGGAAALGGVSFQRIIGEGGIPNAESIEAALRKDDIHYPRTGLICVEMSHYRYGGIVPSIKSLEAVADISKKYEIPVHLDGARLFNAAIQLNTSVKNITKQVSSVMFCLSKGLGAPVGSMLCGSTPFIERAKRYRKMLGGGMRQTGWLCACGIEALSAENISKLKTDHENASLLAELLNANPEIDVNISATQTNFVIAHFKTTLLADSLYDYLKTKGILINKAKGKQIVFVTSKQVDEDDILETANTIRSFLNAENI